MGYRLWFFGIIRFCTGNHVSLATFFQSPPGPGRIGVSVNCPSAGSGGKVIAGMPAGKTLAARGNQFFSMNACTRVRNFGAAYKLQEVCL